MNVSGFRSYGYIYDDASSDVIDYLEKKGKDARESKEFYIGRSVVGIEEQYKLSIGDIDQETAYSYFNLFQTYENEFGYVVNNFPNFMGDINPPMTFFDNLRICYQKKAEFHSPTRNEGSHTFITFLNVPFDLEDERLHSSQSRKLANYELSNIGPTPYGQAFNQDTPGSLNFLYNIQAGTGVGSDSIVIDPYTEGRTFLFPSSQVFYINPFYTCDEPLVYVIGSLCFSTKASNDEYRDKPENNDSVSMSSEDAHIDSSNNFFDS